VLPAEAHAKLSCRLVPDQEPADILEKLARHLGAHVPPGVGLRIGPGAHGAPPYAIPSDHPGLQAAGRVLERVYGRPPLVVRMGASVPICEYFKRILGQDTVFFSFSTADEDYHAPNEFFRIARLHEGLAAWALYWEYLGQMGNFKTRSNWP
jgi:acetylornithine deacetylase/succinyl-diaminopimelate desuccinylase-like protein